MDLFDECNVIKYSAYRTAAKVRALQRTLRLEHVRLGIVSGVFYRHNLQPLQNQDVINRSELEAIVYDILFAAQKETSSEMDISISTDKIVQFLYKVYDRQGRGIRIMSAKVALVVLCHARLQEKYQYLFHQLADHNSCLTKRRMEKLLTEFAEIAEHLSESVSFGRQLISSTLTSCFQHCDGNLGINEESFMCWLLNEPQTLVWLSTLYRLQAAEKVCHYVKCDFCKVYPIRGLRYMCLLCLKYNQCQTCFFLGRINKRHKLKHPIQEYCYEISSKEATCAFLKVLRNKLRLHPTRDLLYLPAEHDGQIKSHYTEDHTSSSCSIYHSSLHIGRNELSTKTVVNLYHTVLPVNPQAELQSIIHNLEEENRQLLAQIEERNDSKLGNYLHCHKEQIGAQVERLKLLKFHLSKVNELLPMKTLQYQNGCRQQLCLLESTPVIPKTVKNYKQGFALPPDLDSISPIVKDTDRIVDSRNLFSWQCNQQEYNASMPAESAQNTTLMLPSLTEHSMNDLSVHIFQGSTDNVDCPTGFGDWLQKSETHQQCVSEINEDIDSIIEKLQNVLSSNFSVQDALLSDQDNTHLQEAAAEMEGLLAGLIKSIEHNKSRKNWDAVDNQIFV
ncbi:hypothetical protein R5R35_014629 [Gryllus longicercus]|uniref:ZZ-type domain-containing protein n=1 Tax=Gryllus longicercus TaxID=2509291 RepID=A0AAN9Z6Y1_9ORTH